MEDSGLRDGQIQAALEDLAEAGFDFGGDGGDGAGGVPVNIASLGPDEEAPDDADFIVRNTGDGTTTTEVVGSGSTRPPAPAVMT
ncbi:hypothetical protein [Pseudophaeobacter leonis]|uniref:hypothetical protein n=1 Tax=Pseudophaeobacter leonis TaxID=1144477 RepID=UPI00111C9215|nr:hypothetical protein [Pseudophaeobacter leonis]